MKLKHNAFVTWGHESKSWLSEGVWNPFQGRLIRKVSLERAAAAHGYWSLQDNIISSSDGSSSSKMPTVTLLLPDFYLFCWCINQKTSHCFLYEVWKVFRMRLVPSKACQLSVWLCLAARFHLCTAFPGVAGELLFECWTPLNLLSAHSGLLELVWVVWLPLLLLQGWGLTGTFKEGPKAVLFPAAALSYWLLRTVSSSILALICFYSYVGGEIKVSNTQYTFQS